MKKKLLVLSSFAAVGVLTTSLLVNHNNKNMLTNADQCQHNGFHYEGKTPTTTTSGWQEFWTCCECHQSWLEKPAIGTFANGSESSMTGGVTIGHIAYLPVVEEGGFVNLGTKTIMNDVISTFWELDGDALVEHLDKHTYAYAGCNEINDYQDLELSWTSDGSASYTVTLADNEDLENPIEVATVSTNSYNYGFYIPGNDYYVSVTSSKSATPIYKVTFHTKDNETRYMNVDGGKNIRDLGGYLTTDGKHINYDLVFRGCNLNGNPFANSGSGNLTEKGKKQLRDLGWVTEIDLRTPCTNGSEYGQPGAKMNGDDGAQWAVGNWWDPTNAKFLQADTRGQCYDGMLRWPNDIAHFKTLMPRVFDVMANANNYPVYFHCNAGADRTGTFGFIFNGLLGVPYSTLVKEFELTSFSSGGGFRRRNKKCLDGKLFDMTNMTYDEILQLGTEEKGDSAAYCNSFDAMYALMMDKFANGGTLQEAIYNWLISCGVTPTQIDAFKKIMLDDEDYSQYEDESFEITVLNTETPETYTVQGGKICEELLETPTKARCTFQGWFDLNGNVVNPYDRITKNMTVVAGWSKYSSNPDDENHTILSWTSAVAKESASGGTNNYSYTDIKETGAVEFGTRIEDQYEYSIALPLIKYNDYEQVNFTLNSGWVSSQFSFGTSKDNLVKVGSGTVNKTFPVVVTSDGKLFFNGSEVAITLTSEIMNGTASLYVGNSLNVGAHKDSDFVVSAITTKKNTSFKDVMDVYSQLVAVEDIATSDIAKVKGLLDTLDAKYTNALTAEEKLIYPYLEKFTQFKAYIDNLEDIVVTYVLPDESTVTEEVKFGSSLVGLGESKNGYIIDGYELNGVAFDLNTPITETISITVLAHKYDSLGCVFVDSSIVSEYTGLEAPAGYSKIYKLTTTGYNKDYRFANIDISGYKKVAFKFYGDLTNNGDAYYMNELDPAKSSGYGSTNVKGTWHEVSLVKNADSTWEVFFNGNDQKKTVSTFNEIWARVNPGTYYFTNLAVVEA